MLKAEMETILRWSKDSDEPLTIYTHEKGAAERLIRRGAKLKKTSTHDGRTVAWTLEVPSTWSRWPSPPRKGSKSPEVLEKLRTGLRKAREARFPLQGNKDS